MDLPLGYEGRYRWIVFLPAVTHGLGVPNRYYGLYESGEFKLRGIGGRRHDTTGLARRFEAEMLDLFRAAARTGRVPGPPAAGAPPRGRVRGAGPRRGVARQRARHLRTGWGRRATRSSRSPTRSRRSASWSGPAPRGSPARWSGTSSSTGRAARYRERVRPEEFLEGGERYDPDAYLELLAREAETLLAPFGVVRDDLLARWGYGGAAERGPYRSSESVAQSVLEGDTATGRTF